MNTNNFDSILLVIPAHNESRCIGSIVRELSECWNNILVVDDRSTDSTCELAEKAGALVFRRPKQEGQGAAVRDGLRWAIENGFQYVITLDGDGAHAPKDTIRIGERLLISDVDLVIGSRFANSDVASCIPSNKAAANYFASLLFNAIFQADFSDVASGIRGLGPKALGLPFNANNFSFAFEVLVQSIGNSLTCAEVPIHAQYDAVDSFATSTQEICDFLEFVRNRGKLDLRTTFQISTLIETISSSRFLRVELFGRVFYFHPVNGSQYLVQQQHGWFLQNKLITEGHSAEIDLRLSL